MFVEKEIHRVTRIERVAYDQGSSVDPTQIENIIGEVDAARPDSCISGLRGKRCKRDAGSLGHGTPVDAFFGLIVPTHRVIPIFELPETRS
jgi:hypothetical protein